MSKETIYVVGPNTEENWPPGVQTIHLDGQGKRVYPCRCGQTHRGDWGLYEWDHHNCFHNDPLIEIDSEEVPGYLMCPACCKTFWRASALPKEDV